MKPLIGWMAFSLIFSQIIEPPIIGEPVVFPFFTLEDIRPLFPEQRNNDYIFFRPTKSGSYLIKFQANVSSAWFTIYSYGKTLAANQNYPIEFQYNQYFFQTSRQMRIAVERDGVPPEYFQIEVAFADNFVLNPAEMENKIYRPNGYLTKLSLNKHPQKTYEQFDFTGYESFQIQELYYQVELTAFSFGYLGGIEQLPAQNSLLTIYDPHLLFPKFVHDVDSQVKIPLVLAASSTANRYHFQWRDQMYIEPITRICAPYLEDGFTPVNNLRFPLNSFTTGREIDLLLTCGPLGANGTRIMYQTRLKSLHPFYSQNWDSTYFLSTANPPVSEWGTTLSEVIIDA